MILSSYALKNILCAENHKLYIPHSHSPESYRNATISVFCTEYFSGCVMCTVYCVVMCGKLLVSFILLGKGKKQRENIQKSNFVWKKSLFQKNITRYVAEKTLEKIPKSEHIKI